MLGFWGAPSLVPGQTGPFGSTILQASSNSCSCHNLSAISCADLCPGIEVWLPWNLSFFRPLGVSCSPPERLIPL